MGDLEYQGRFVWYDLMSTNVEASKAFFTRLFGWTTEDWDQGGGKVYTMFKVGNRQAFGGIVQTDQAQGVPSHWLSYISTGDTGSFVARASDLGATVITAPTDIPGVGTYAVLTDPQGALFAAFSEPEKSPVIAPGERVHGEVLWNELTTSDVEAAKAFYSRMFNWTTSAMEGGSIPYTVLHNNGNDVGGMMAKTEDMPASAWVVYFRTGSAEQTQADIASLGGAVIAPVFDVPDIGKICWGLDPAGAIFAVIEPAPRPQS